jgi:hypothetical protein
MNQDPNLVHKVHPASREVLPDDPLNLHGFEVPGDSALMLRLLVEEYARLGADTEQILGLARDPFYHAFHGLYRLFGEQELRRRVSEIVQLCGVIRVRKREQAPPPEQIVQINISAAN